MGLTLVGNHPKISTP